MDIYGRKDDGYIGRRMLRMELPGKRKRGRPKRMFMGNSVVTDVQFGHLFVVCIKYDALEDVNCGLFRKISPCS